MAQTEKGIIYPYDYNEVADVPSDFKALAESIDALLNDYSLKTDSGNKIVLEMNNTTYKIKAALKDKDDNVISTSNEIDLPLENMVTNISYNDQTLTLTHQDGQTTEVSIADLISDLASKEEVSELQSQVDDLTTLVETELDTNTVEGTEIDVSDSAEYRGKIEVKGNTEQKQLGGKSVLDPSTIGTGTINGINYSYDENTQEITLNGTCTKDNTLISFVNTNIIASASKTTFCAYCVDGSISGYGALRFYDADYRKACILYINELTKGNYTLKQANASYEAVNNNFRFNAGAVCNNFKIKVMVTDSTDTTYEPYCGGQASPNPDYPQEIKVVTGDNVVKHVGKNLFDKDNANTINAVPDLSSITSSIYAKSFYIKIKPNTIYTVSRQVVGARFVVGTTSETPTVGVSVIDRVVNNNGSSITITSSSNANYLVVYYLYDSNENEQVILSSIQVEEGSTATSYEPYRGEDYNLNLGNIELCKIGDYSDILFKNEVGDENYKAELESGVWYEKDIIKKRILNGSETLRGTGINNIYYYAGITNYTRNNNIPLCSHFNGFDTVDSAAQIEGINRIGFNNTYDYNRFYISFDGTIEELANLLAEKTPTLYYATDNPTYTKITNPTLISQLEVLRKAKWFKGVNHFWTETENLEPVLKGTYKQSNNLRIKSQDERLDNLESRLALLE